VPTEPPQDDPAPEGARTSTGGWRQAFDALAIEQYRLLFVGMLGAQAAMQINIVARAWLAYSISGSGLALGVVMLARGLPMALLSLVGGAVADRARKRTLLITVQVLLSLIAVVNAVLVHLDVVEIWHLALLGLAEGVVFAFNMPTRQALIPELVDDARLPNALALNSTGMNLNRVIAPSIAGVLLAWQPAVAYDTIAMLYIVAALLLLRLPKLEAPARHTRNALADVADGLRYVRRSPELVTLLSMAFIPVLLGMPFQQLLPVFQQDVLHVDESALGLMYTAAGIGALSGSLIVATFARSPRKRAMQLIAGVLFGALLVLFALSQVYAVSLVLLVLVGFASQGYMTLNSVLLMTATDREYYGRVMSIYMVTFSLMPISMLPMGILVDSVGVQAAVGGAGLLMAVLLVCFVVWERGRTRATPRLAEVARDADAPATGRVRS